MTLWLVVESNGTFGEQGTIAVVELHSHHENGELKKFWLDGEGQLWMPYVNPQDEQTGKTPPFPAGRLLLVSLKEPTAEMIEAMIPLATRNVVIIPARH